VMQDFHDMTLLLFPCKNWKAKWMSSLVSL
jgi:hypothetical protein